MSEFRNGVTEAGMSPEASLSYDGQYVLSGETRGLMLPWLPCMKSFQGLDAAATHKDHAPPSIHVVN
jgi:hypothetical protein